jgi:beta-ketodecanoyl-[acyl-carrier-protein] synthase
MSVVISGTGLFTPEETVTNEELVIAFNQYVDQYNKDHAEEIKNGELQALEYSDSAFIEKASGIKSRHVMDKKNVLDPNVMTQNLPDRPNDELSVMAEMGKKACEEAIKNAGKTADQIDGIILASSGHQRPYPAIAVEIQEALGIDGFGFDMNIACSSATFAIQIAADMIKAGNANAILVTNPEFCSAQLNFRDRDCHFIFGDVATAILLEKKELSTSDDNFEIISTKIKTQYSNNIRNNFGILDRFKKLNDNDPGKIFVQEGRKVFRDVTPMVSELILNHLEEQNLTADNMKRLWLHQANIHMNEFISKKVLGREPANDEAPIILDEYANTAAAGSIIAFHKYKQGFEEGDMGLICSFGAGYSVGSVILKKV